MITSSTSVVRKVPKSRIVIYPGADSFPLNNDVTAMPLPVAADLIRNNS